MMLIRVKGRLGGARCSRHQEQFSRTAADGREAMRYAGIEVRRIGYPEKLLFILEDKFQAARKHINPLFAIVLIETAIAALRRHRYSNGLERVELPRAGNRTVAQPIGLTQTRSA